MNVLVTGGAGFIGGYVADHLQRAGHDVTVVDNLSTGSRDNMPAGISLVKADILDRGAFLGVVRRLRPRAIMHLAAQMNVRASLLDPAFDAKVNVVGGVHVLEACAENRVERLVFASSGGAVYGEGPGSPVSEGFPPQPESPYGVAKLCFEQYARCFKGTRSVRATHLRLSNVYGPRQNPAGEAGVVAIFASLMLQGKRPVVFGDGEASRDYVYVEDAARAFLAALEGPDGTYNIGTGTSTSVLELFRRLARLLRFSKAPMHRAAIRGELRRISLDCTSARRRLRWSPRVSLEEGLRLTADFFRERALGSMADRARTSAQKGRNLKGDPPQELMKG